MTEEEWKPVNIKGVIIPDYFVSYTGQVKSTKRKTEKLLKINDRDCRKEGGTGRGNASSVGLSKPKDLIIDEYNGEGKKHLTYQVHQLVMWAHRPIEQYPPECLKDVWHLMPPEGKKWVRDTVTIDHIDDNPFNNHVDNLRYVRPKDNNRQRKHHGNKSEDSV